MIVCPKCFNQYELTRLASGKKRDCPVCNRARAMRWNRNNIEKHRGRSRRVYHKNIDSIRAKFKIFYKENAKQRIAAVSAWRKANPEKARANSRKWFKANPGKANAKTAKRFAAKRQRTPKWLTKDHYHQITNIYIEASRLGMTVDHIVPLRGKIVSGLHVPWNLQILSASENYRKGNSYGV